MMKISNLSSQSIQQLINNKKDGIVLGQNDFSFFIYGISPVTPMVSSLSNKVPLKP